MLFTDGEDLGAELLARGLEMKNSVSSIKFEMPSRYPSWASSRQLDVSVAP